MEAKIGSFFNSVGNFLRGGDQIPWSDRQIIADLEQQLASAKENESEEQRRESIMTLYWVLVHSKQRDDVKRGIAMLKASLDDASSSSTLQIRKKLYLLAVGYYRSGKYSISIQLVERCLRIEPDCGQEALILKKAVEDKIAKEGVMRIGIAATAVGLIVAGIAAAAARKN